MRTMLTALGSRRDSLKNEDGQKGFTLIELLVVVIIIGILAAIAIPVYLGVQDSAKDSGAKSDLANAKIAVVGYMTDNTSASYATAFAALYTAGAVTDVGVKYGFTLSPNTKAMAVATMTPAGLCITANSDSSGKPVFNVTDKGVKQGATCGSDTPSVWTTP